MLPTKKQTPKKPPKKPGPSNKQRSVRLSSSTPDLQGMKPTKSPVARSESPLELHKGPSEVEPEIEPVVEPEIEPEIEPKVEPEIEPKVEPKIEPKVGPKIEPKVGPKIEPKVGPKIEPEVEHVASPVMPAKVCVEGQPGANVFDRRALMFQLAALRQRHA